MPNTATKSTKATKSSKADIAKAKQRFGDVLAMLGVTSKINEYLRDLEKAVADYEAQRVYHALPAMVMASGFAMPKDQKLVRSLKIQVNEFSNPHVYRYGDKAEDFFEPEFEDVYTASFTTMPFTVGTGGSITYDEDVGVIARTHSLPSKKAMTTVWRNDDPNNIRYLVVTMGGMPEGCEKEFLGKKGHLYVSVGGRSKDAIISGAQYSNIWSCVAYGPLGRTSEIFGASPAKLLTTE